jgi:hypothetical protein
MAVLAAITAGPVGVLAVAAVLAVSDLLLLLLMRGLGVEDRTLLVLPLVRGTLAPTTLAWKEAVLVLARPAFLLLLSEASYQVAQATGGNLAAGVSKLVLWVGALLLVPMQPFDGWRLLDLGLASRARLAEVGVTGLFAVLLTVTGAARGEPVLMGLGAFLGVATFNVLKLARAATDLQAAGVSLEARVTELPQDTMAALRQALTVPLAASLARWRARPPETAVRVEANLLAEVYRRAARRPTAPAGVVLLSGAWVAMGAAFVWAILRVAGARAGVVP